MLHHASELFVLVLCNCKERMLKSHGWRYIGILMQYPYRYFNCFRLRTMLEPTEEETSDVDICSIKEAKFMNIIKDMLDLPIEKTDINTLKTIARRFKVLRRLEAELKRNNDLARLQDIRDEIEELNTYLEETTGPRGIKKFFQELEIREYHAVEADIRRFLLKVKKLDEKLYWQLKAHLKIGLQCAWIDD